MTVQNLLDACRVAKEAEQAIRRLPFETDRQLVSLYSYLSVDEPSIHLLPLHFLPSDPGCVVGPATLHDLGVAAKLEYTRNRWLDEMVDAHRPSSLPLSVHRLNDAVIALTFERYERVLDSSVAAPFYRVLSNLHARHGMSVVLDGQGAGYFERVVCVREYVEHARARHGPLRAPLDALLLLACVSERTMRKARVAWQNWALGVQFYDDALDVEEDYRDRNLSWVVARTLEVLRNGSEARVPSLPLDPDAFHAIALTEGVVCRALAFAETFFSAAARQAEGIFPTWAVFQCECLSRTASLRKDYERIIAEAKARA